MTEQNDANDAVTCVILRAHLRQITAQYASSYEAYSLKHQ
ncbi:Uncharacterised protein [Segatella oris]|uniref:Uncharacterized protein n=1 Tax=Segatella oris TaxID=28135 RepID=A0A3S4T5U8_9BACT|nr:Uncharacterised protein [Segatella oris]